jgi:hypothetical protein
VPCVAIGVAIGVALSIPTAAWAQDLTYEEERTAAVLAREGLEAVEPAEAEGRPIAFVRIVRDDVFVEDDGGLFGWLTWANTFHWLTQESVIRRELLLEENDPYSNELVEETMRNLRGLPIFSYVRVVPVRVREGDGREGDGGAGDGGVGLLVYTRDLWSLRFEQNFQITGATVDRLLLQLTERNLFGYEKRASIRFFLLPDVYRVGQVYVDRRVANGSLSLTEAFDLIFNRDSGALEGAEGQAVLRSPFYDLSQRWGFDLRGLASTRVRRELVGGEIATYDIPETMEEEAIPRVWREQRYQASAGVLYRVGERYKQTFGLEAAYEESIVEPNAETGLAPGQGEAFARDILPRTRREIGPVLSYELFMPTYATYENLSSYGVSENVRTGPTVEASVGFPLALFGSSTDSVVFRARYGYVLSIGDFLAEASLEGSARLEDGRVVDQVLETELRGATPRFGFLRLVWRGRWIGRRNDTSQPLVTLGGDDGLRGFVSQALAVKGDGNLVSGNLELRTAPIVLWSVHVGAVLFYDVGAVYESTHDIAVHHAVGLGLRVMFPQFNRLPFRFDAGVPIGEDAFSVGPSFGSTQAVPLTAYEDEQAL